MRNRTTRRLGMLLTLALGAQASGCGLILYPERKGQKSGDIDATVAVLDGIGLLFFIIPGVIAFVVDFHHGTIYLPGTSKTIADASRNASPGPDSPDLARWIAVPAGPGPLDAATIRSVVARHTGCWVDLADPRLEVAEMPGDARE